MSTIVLKSDSSDNLNLLIALANKLGIEVSVLSDETIEDLGLANAMKSARTREYVDTTKFLQSLSK